MHKYNPKYHNRISRRLKGYDYSQSGLYFLTLNCRNRIRFFGEIKNGEMHLNTLGKIAHEEWKNTSNVRKNVVIHEFVIMPDHIHGIIEIKYCQGDNQGRVGKFVSSSQTVGSIVRGYKIAVLSKIRKSVKFSDNDLKYLINSTIWQRDYYEHIIRNVRAYQNITAYIIDNPRNWSE